MEPDIAPDMTFGAWTVIRLSSSDRHGNRRWLVRCRCGTRATVLALNLRHGLSTQCVKCRARARRLDLTGETIGRLEVKVSLPDGQWHCRCLECDRFVELTHPQLIRWRQHPRVSWACRECRPFTLMHDAERGILYRRTWE